MSTLSDKVDYYVDKLILQFKTAQKARAQVGLFVQAAIADDLAPQVGNAYALETAVGPQLDVIGRYVGIPRNIGSPLPQGYFGLWDVTSARVHTLYQGTWDPASDTPTLPAAAGGNAGWWYVASANGTSSAPISATFVQGNVIFSNGSVWAKDTTDNGNGMTDVTNPAINLNAQFYDTTFAGGLNTNLTDDQYRLAIKLKIATNNGDGTLASTMQSLNQLFGGAISLTDNLDMTLTYVVASTVNLPLSVLQAYLPRPAGVGITVTTGGSGGSGLLLTEAGDFLTTEAGDFIEVTI